jgi:hypothetical protein
MYNAKTVKTASIYGIYRYPYRHIYEGEWLDGKKNGQGKYTCTGDFYEGGYIDDKRNGQGKYMFASGDVYEGGCKDDKRVKGSICLLVETSLKVDRW